LIPEDTQHVVQGFGRPEISAPPKGVPAAIPMNQPVSAPRRAASITSKALYHDASFASTQPEKLCSLCELVGRRTAHTHKLEHCYSNPQNSKATAWSVRLRYNDIISKKLPMPKCIQEYHKEQEGRWDANKKVEEAANKTLPPPPA
jgi:hypothetical protein